jgi:2-aminobenzoate-CoA ligase
MAGCRLGAYTAHVDTFTRDHLPPPAEWPDFIFTLPELQYPPRLNAGRVLLDEACSEGNGARRAVLSESLTWTYDELLERSNRIALVLVRECGLVPGNRVLLHGANSPWLAAAWFACVRAGGVAVTTMPMLRAKELGQIAVKAQIDHCLCDARVRAEVAEAAAQTGRLRRILTWNDGALEARAARQSSVFAPVDTASDDVALLAFTSGTTGQPKATMHFHRDVLAMADVVGRHMLETTPDDVHIGSPPLGFTYGLGVSLVLPLRFRAATVLIERPSAEALLEGVARFRATALFTAPTMYRRLIAAAGRHDLSSLRQAVSAGEFLPKATAVAWRAATGLHLMEGIGATEMIHIFIGARAADTRPGWTGRALPGYEAAVLADDGTVLPPGSTGRLAVRGPTGCRYLGDARQRDYVLRGWNVTGDQFHLDEHGYFRFEARADDMIISAGYNIAGPEVEGALATHAAVKECAVIGAADEQRGQIVKAYVVTNEGHAASPELARILQEHVKATIAPYKYPRAVEFLPELPRTPTGKIQRFVLRQRQRR